MNLLLDVGSVLAAIVLWPLRALIDFEAKIEDVLQSQGFGSKGFTVVVPLTYSGSDFYGNIELGTPIKGEPQQVLRVSFDTLSNQLWVAGVEGCPSSDCSSMQIKPFNGSMSSSYKKFKKGIEDVFPDNKKLMGHISQDRVRLGTGDIAVEVKRLIFGEAHTLGEMFVEREALFGLSLMSRQRVANKPTPPIWLVAKRFKNPVFGFHFNKRTIGPNAGRLVIGGDDQQFYEGELNSHPIIKKGKFYDGWQINIHRITIMKFGQLLNSVDLFDLYAVPSTNSATCEGPKWLIDQINYMIYKSANLDYNEHNYLPCDSKELPSVTVFMGGVGYTIPPEAYLEKVKDKGDNDCRPGFVAANTRHFLLGQTFMQQYYTRFNVRKKSVEFGLASGAKHQDKHEEPKETSPGPQENNKEPKENSPKPQENQEERKEKSPKPQ